MLIMIVMLIFDSYRWRTTQYGCRRLRGRAKALATRFEPFRNNHKQFLRFVVLIFFYRCLL